MVLLMQANGELVAGVEEQTRQALVNMGHLLQVSMVICSQHGIPSLGCGLRPQARGEDHRVAQGHQGLPRGQCCLRWVLQGGPSSKGDLPGDLPASLSNFLLLNGFGTTAIFGRLPVCRGRQVWRWRRLRWSARLYQHHPHRDWLTSRAFLLIFTCMRLKHDKDDLVFSVAKIPPFPNQLNYKCQRLAATRRLVATVRCSSSPSPSSPPSWSGARMWLTLIWIPCRRALSSKMLQWLLIEIHSQDATLQPIWGDETSL